MRTKSVLLLMLALGCGLVASIGITQVMANRDTSDTPSSDTVDIFVALEDLPTGDLINAKMLKLEPWPKDKVPPGALTKMEQLEGRRPKSKIYAGSPILDNQLLGKGLSAGATSEIPPGYRAVSVRVDAERGGSNLIRPGDRVDVMLYTQGSRNNQVIDTCVQTILQDIKVFAVNDIYDLETTEPGQTIQAKTVSLLVKPGQAERVMLANQMGKIQLSIRSHEDKEFAEVEPVYPHEIGSGERASRKDEELAQASPPTANSGTGNDFVSSLLQSQNPLQSQNSQASPPEAASPKNSWVMKVIEADKVSEVVMESPERPGTEDAEPSGLSSWKLIFSPQNWRPATRPEGDSASGGPAGAGHDGPGPSTGDAASADREADPSGGRDGKGVETAN